MSEKKYYKVLGKALITYEAVRETASCFYVKTYGSKQYRYRKADYFETPLEAWEAAEEELRRRLQWAKDEVSRRQQLLQIAQKEVAIYRKTNK